MSAERFDLAIVGGGAAGLGAAVRAAAEGARVVVLERGALGGSLLSLPRVEAVPGLPVGLGGAELAERGIRQALRFGADLRAGVEVEGVRAEGETLRVSLAGGSSLEARAVVLATGLQLPDPCCAPGVCELAGSGVYLDLPATLPATLRSGDVFLAGDPAATLAAGARLARHCRSVTLLATEDAFPAELAERVRGEPNLSLRPHAEIVEAAGVERIETLLLRDRRSGRSAVRTATALFLLGVGAPRTGWLAATLPLDGRGFVPTGERPAGWPLRRDPSPLETALPGVFAAGGARSGSVKRVESALEEGIAAARESMEHLRGPAPGRRARTDRRSVPQPRRGS